MNSQPLLLEFKENSSYENQLPHYTRNTSTKVTPWRGRLHKEYFSEPEMKIIFRVGLCVAVLCPSLKITFICSFLTLNVSWQKPQEAFKEGGSIHSDSIAYQNVIRHSEGSYSVRSLDEAAKAGGNPDWEGTLTGITVLNRSHKQYRPYAR